jgi:hypothetical protein
MNVLGKLFNKKSNYETNNKFNVLIIGEDKTDFQEMLGITEERGQVVYAMASLCRIRESMNPDLATILSSVSDGE